MTNENFRREIGHVFDEMAGSPSSALPDRVRSSLAHVPEQRGPYWIAGLAAALIAAVVIGVLVVANPLNRPANTVAPGAGTNSSPTPGPTPGPTLSPEAPPNPQEAQFVCTGGSAILPEYAQAPLPAVIDAVRTGTHAGYDRLTIQIKSGGATDVRATIQTSDTFTRSPRGDQVTLAGKNGILVIIHNADLHTGYSGPADIKTGYASLVEIQTLEDFEGVGQLGIGVSGAACFRRFALSNPNRVVIDVQNAS